MTLSGRICIPENRGVYWFHYYNYPEPLPRDKEVMGGEGDIVPMGGGGDDNMWGNNWT